MNIAERIYICTRPVSKDDVNVEKEEIISDFDNLVFENIPFAETSDINYNGGEDANPFDKIAKYYGRKKNVFLFISLLRNAEFSALILKKIKEKCTPEQLDKFIERTALYLTRIKQGEATAKEFLNEESFADAFFNGYHCGEKKNFHENLNVNFTQSTQFLDIQDIFDRKIDCKESGDLRRVKIYENGLRAVTIENEEGVRKYKFSKDASCQLVLIMGNTKLFLDIIAGKVSTVEQEVNEARSIITKGSELLEDFINYTEILINSQNLKDVLHVYFEKENGNTRSWFVQDQCLPIKTLADLGNWSPAEHQHVTERLLKRKKVEGPKTLVCHDMRGGYLDDRFVNGTNGKENYFFVHWQHVDVFVYFSHNLVTIPPCSWITAAHRNGVRVLGTFITEWADGEKICNEFLKDEKSAYDLAMRLVNIAKLCNFEGWLINIENKLKPEQIPVLRRFLSILTSKMASFCSDSQVIWYDSVIKNGELKWQNALNNNNKMFFNVCDGIFLNYNWKDEHLATSVKTALERQTDVYVGVDVFGRGCFGGGGFATDLAVAEARKLGLSVAIFAPGWVHECQDVKKFRENQFKFWGALQQYCPARTIMEFNRTSFCPGFGNAMYRKGEIISNKPWYNLGLQSLQQIYAHTIDGNMELSWNNIPHPYDGGGCLFLSEKSIIEGRIFKIFETDLMIERDIIIGYSCSKDFILLGGMLVLQFKSGLQLNFTQRTNQMLPIPKYEIGDKFIFPSTKEELLKRGYSLRENHQKVWETRTYLLNDFFLGDSIQNISLEFENPSVPLRLVPGLGVPLLGDLEITALGKRYDLMHRDFTYDWDAAKTSIKVQCVLEWKYQTAVPYSDLFVEIPGKEREYVATTSQLNFKLEYTFPSINSFNVILCPQSEDLESESLWVYIFNDKFS